MEKKRRSNGSKKSPLARDNVKKTKNRKVKNATPMSYDGVDFKSRLEMAVYKMFKEAGFDIKYESCKYVLWKGFKPTIPFYNRKKRFQELKLDNKKIMDITYTPDFQFSYKDHLVIIETKGVSTDVYMIKRKLFRQHLEQNYPNSLYFEVHSVNQVDQVFDVIRKL